MFYRLLTTTAIVFFMLTVATHTRAADTGRGQRLAESQCASCHSVAPPERKEVADAPPFAVIARKYDFDADTIARAIAGPHPKMNFSPQADEAADLAAYIATQGR